MSGFKNVMKDGWHPKGKEGGKESWRGDFKGINQVAGWVGRGKQSDSSEASTHVSRPLASLKDPSAFGPPPRNVNYHGGAALPNEITPHRGGLGAPLTEHQVASAKSGQKLLGAPEQEVEEQQKVAAPPLPYRADRTGLRTDNLPPPPKHVDLNNASPVQSPQAARPTPSLPPRLPSRQNTATPPPPPSYSAATAKTTSQSSTPTLNQSAVNRLGNAGISVPALGIGKSSNTATSPTAEAPSWKSSKPSIPTPGLSELQSRFSRMNTVGANSSTSQQQIEATTTSLQVTSPQPQTDPAKPPSWQQTRSALTTANAAYKDPTSVTLQDAQSAAQTAQNAQRSASAFRERHNETISAAQTRATQLNKRYNMTGRLNKFLEDANNAHDKQEQEVATQAVQPGQPGQTTTQTLQQQPQPQQVHSPPAIPQQPNPWAMQQPLHSPQPPTQQASSPSPPKAHQPAKPELAASISRKPPPPPPPKKPTSMQAPPPVPLGTKPNFG